MSNELKKIIGDQAQTINFLRSELKAEREKDGSDVLILHRQTSGKPIYGTPDTFYVTTAINVLDAEHQADGGEYMARQLAERMVEKIMHELRRRGVTRTQTEIPDSCG